MAGLRTLVPPGTELYARGNPKPATVEEPALKLPGDEAPRTRWLRLSLAGLWLFDAALQAQPFMFGSGFARMLASAARGNPAPVATPITAVAHLIGQHPVAAGALFVAVQLALGLGIAWRPAARPALLASAAWSLAVWWLGEGFGGLLAGTASPVTGAPGAVPGYALLAVLLWAARGNSRVTGAARWPVTGAADQARAAGQAGAASQTRAASQALARAAWLLLWGGLAWLSVTGAHAAMLPVFRQAPGSLALAAVFAAIAAGVLLPAPARRVAVMAAVAVSLGLWVAGQDFGGIFTGHGTDPGTGLPLALLALAYWPDRTRHPHSAPAGPVRAQTENPHLAWPSGRLFLATTGRDVTAMQVLMGLSMAGMLLPRFDPVPAAAWAALAVAGAAWFGWRFLRELTRAPAGRAAASHLPHVLACGAMLYMSADRMLAIPGPPAGGMATAGPAPAAAVALALAVAMAGCTAVITDQLAAIRPALARAQRAAGTRIPARSFPEGSAPGGRASAGPAPEVPATAPETTAMITAPEAAAAAGLGPETTRRSLLAPRVAACCQLAMGASMACLLVQML